MHIKDGEIPSFLLQIKIKIMKILLDVMGGDHCPTEAIKGAVTALKKIESDIVLIGKEELIKKEIKKIYGKEDIKQISERLSIINADEVVENTDVPLQAIKRKKNCCTKLLV